MRKLSLLCGVLLASTGCKVVGDGVYLVILPVMDNTECDTSIDENFTDAQVPEDGIPDSEWVYTDETTSSDALLFMSVTEGPKGEVYVVLGDAVYTGMTEKGVTTVSWTHSVDDNSKEQHESGYTYQMTDITTITETLTFEKNKDNTGLKGKWKIDSESNVSWTESDDWDPALVGLYGGQIPGWQYLEGAGTSNSPDMPECSGDCTLSVVSSCTGSVDNFRALKTDYDDSAFDAVENAGQDPGV